MKKELPKELQIWEERSTQCPTIQTESKLLHLEKELKKVLKNIKSFTEVNLTMQKHLKVNQTINIQKKWKISTKRDMISTYQTNFNMEWITEEESKQDQNLLTHVILRNAWMKVQLDKRKQRRIKNI